MKDLDDETLTESDFESSFAEEPPPTDPQADLTRGRVLRRRRLAVLTGVPVAAVAATVFLALLNPWSTPLVGVPADLPSPSAQSSPEESQPANQSASPSPLSGSCGQEFHFHASGGALKVTARFPTATRSGPGAILSGTVEVTGGKQRVRGVASPTPEVFLVRGGRIVTLPLPRDLIGVRMELDPGEVTKMPAQAGLTACDPDTAGTGSLRPGTYQLYARVVLNLDNGSTLESLGGPLPLRVR